MFLIGLKTKHHRSIVILANRSELLRLNIQMRHYLIKNIYIRTKNYFQAYLQQESSDEI